jgi:N-acetylmuramoyl-L-alanine amidase
MAKTGTIVLDPGHGGQHEIGGSSANNAISSSGVLEKNITLRMAFLVREALEKIAADQRHELKIILTREEDKNLALAARARVAKTKKADLFLSIHCNGFNGRARGTETLVSPITSGNTNHQADREFAQMIQNAVFNAIKHHDPKATDRGVKDQRLGVLSDLNLGPVPRSCLLELEFIDVKSVDQLLNIGPNSLQVRIDIAQAIAMSLIDAL